tara:strand:+ start:355 stop:1242 length:888 start_codon:yes stop_codon:yes gene_type:complete
VSEHAHVAGIIPLANLETDHGLEVPPCMLPLAAGFTAIQKSVFECAMAGCDTIWIVANADLAPIVRKTVGEWVHDPVYYNRTMTKFYKEVRKEIPIYYVPIDVRDRDRRDSYGWSVLHGVNSAWWVGNKISKWLVPDKYFISFPLSAYNVYSLRDHRKKIASKNFNFFVTYNNQTVKNNLPLAFTMTGEDFIQCRRNVNKLTTREYLPPLEGERLPSRRLPLEQRWSARKFDFETVFEKIDETNLSQIEVDWFYDLSSWENYRAFLGSDNIIKKPYKGLTGPHRHAKICLIKDEE